MAPTIVVVYGEYLAPRRRDPLAYSDEEGVECALTWRAGAENGTAGDNGGVEAGEEE
jgi:hypothetical protein